MLNLLVAYPYLNNALIERLKPAIDSGRVRLLVDSGAFTAWKAGKTISVDDYQEFLRDLPFTPWRYFTLDVIGDPVGTRSNYQTMRAAGFSPIPIFTRGEDHAHLDRLYETSDLVGVGGLVKTIGNTGFVKGIMDKIGDRRVHWLGFARPDYLTIYRPYSCDASSLFSGAQFGLVILCDARGRLTRFGRDHFLKRPSPDVFRLFAEYDEDASDFRYEEVWRDRTKLMRLGALSYIRYQQHLERLGTHYFLAMTHLKDIAVALDGVDFWTRKKERCLPAPAASNSVPATGS